MTTLREAAQQALEALEFYKGCYGSSPAEEAIITALKAALAETVQEPLPFGIEERAGVRVLYSKDGSCRPATAEEWLMWRQMRAHGIGGEE